MRTLLALALAAAMAGGALADYPTLAIFWDADFTQTNLSITEGGSHNMYLVLLDPPEPAIALVEGALQFTGFIIASVAWEGGGTNPIAHDNFACVWPLATVGPFPVNQGGATLLATYNVFAFGAPGDVKLGPFTPTSIPGTPTPAIADQTNTFYYPCGWATGVPPGTPGDASDYFHLLATINGSGVVATEHHTLSGVKSLFR